MREDWKSLPLQDLVERIETSDPRKAPDEPFTYIDVSSVSRATLSVAESTQIVGAEAPSRARRLVRKDDVVFATIRPTLKRIAQIPVELDSAICSTGFFVLRPKDTVFGRYLFYWLLGEQFSKAMKKLQRGASYPAVSDSDVKKQYVSLPPLPEQKLIVAILDEAFAGIDAAIANTEKNLANARELFDSTLRYFLGRGADSWVEKPLGECIRLKSGDNLTAKKMVAGKYPVFGGNGVAGEHNKYNLSGSNVIVGRVGALCGNARYVHDNIWLTDNAFKVSEKLQVFDDKFLAYLLNFKSLRTYARQSAQPVISNSSLKDVNLVFPWLKSEQRIIAEKIDEVQAEIDKVKTVYNRKLIVLAELKQSLLQKAFSGELTAERAEAAVEEVTA
ncbi:restriction endonuclease subunit S [Halomonas sp.]|uniref:restriction endonuclease subunit S n=1 Tax=Halomonas sp. TaxID=1486246 RepID=UPI00356B0D1D